MTADQFNGVFETLAIFFILNHSYTLYQHKEVKGVSILSTIFFLVWSIFNALYFYSAAGLFWSWLASCFVLAAQILWVSLAIYYTRKLK